MTREMRQMLGQEPPIVEPASGLTDGVELSRRNKQPISWTTCSEGGVVLAGLYLMVLEEARLPFSSSRSPARSHSIIPTFF